MSENQNTNPEYQNTPQDSAERERASLQNQSRVARIELQNELSLDQQKVMAETNDAQKEMMDEAGEKVKDSFNDIYNLGNARAKSSVGSLMHGFLSQLKQIDSALTERRKLVAKDSSLTDEEKIAKINLETLKEKDQEIRDIIEYAQNFAKDIKENGGKNSLEALLKAEDELKIYLDMIHGDKDMKEALAFTYNFDDTQRTEKKDKIFTMLADKIISKPNELRAWSLVIKKLSLNEIKEFRDKYFGNNKAKLVDSIVQSKNEYASMIYITLYGEAEYLRISGLTPEQKTNLVNLNRSLTDYQDKAERLERRSIGARNTAMDMLSGENVLGLFGMLWGTATAGLNLFVELGGGKFKKDPAKALESAIKNPYVWGGGVAAGSGFALVTGGVDSFLESMGPEDEKAAELKQKATNRMKNLLISDRHPLCQLATSSSARFALASFAKNKIEIDGLKHISELKNPEQTLTKKYFMQYLDVLIDETRNPEDKNALMQLKNYMRNIPYGNKEFSELVINLSILEIGGEDIKSTDKNFEAFKSKL
ncbi:MAG: hypothetical protein RBS56_04970 [Candidatus Gracilibacteria bacterium]|jgi:hypothetical protein|nr:hypothetical protein [Candidatus Gracilibacteria bacterium]